MSSEPWEIIYNQSGHSWVLWDGPLSRADAEASYQEVLARGYRPVDDDVQIVPSGGELAHAHTRMRV